MSGLDFDRVVAINFKGVFLGCKYAIPHLLENPDGGAILNMSSNGGLVGRRGSVSIAERNVGMGQRWMPLTARSMSSCSFGTSRYQAASAPQLGFASRCRSRSTTS